MTAFDQAWVVLKMPLVPGSFKEIDTGMEGRFLDPKTKEELPVSILDDGFHVFGGISEPNESNRAHLTTEGSDDIDGRFAMKPVDVETKPDYRRRGYATALYDAMAEYLSKPQSSTHGPVTYHDPAGFPLARHGEQSEDARKFWGLDRNTWPVREDLRE